MTTPAVITGVMEVNSNNEDINETVYSLNKDTSDITEDISKHTDEETHNKKDENNIKEHLESIVCNDISSSKKNICSNHEELQNIEASNNLIKDNYLTDGIKTDKTGNEIQDGNKSNTNENSNTAAKVVLNRFLSLIDNDSEGEIDSCKIVNIESFTADNDCDSRSSESLEISKYKKYPKNKNIKKIKSRSESKEYVQASNIDDLPQTIHKNTISNSYQDLIDSESDEETTKTVQDSNVFDNTNVSKTKNNKGKYVKKGSLRASKDEAMRQIHSETQRLIRETEISLPYHRPKQRTLQEFLNRNKLSATFPKTLSTAAKLKMSSAIVSQVLAEKEKEAELFYKSSDSEDDTQFVNCKNMKISTCANEKMSSTDTEHVSIQDTKKMEIDQNSHNKRGITEYVDPDTSGRDECEVNHEKRDLFLLTQNNNNQNNILVQEVIKEHEQNFHKIDVPRRLFDTCSTDEISEVLDINYNQEELIKETADINSFSLNKQEHFNSTMEPEITMTKDHILQTIKTQKCISELTNRNQDLISETMEISNTCASNEQVIEKLQRNNCLTDNDATCTNSNNCVIIQDGNNEERNKCAETNDILSSSDISINNIQSKDQENVSTEKCKKPNSHVVGLPPPQFADENLIDKKKLLSKLTLNSKVTLKGSPDMMIDVTIDTKSNKKNVNTLLNRFFLKHVANTKKQTDNKCDVTVIHLQDTQDGPMAVKEVFSYGLPNVDNSELNKPGAKLKRLKEDLKLQMTLKRNNEWKQKEKEIELQMQETEKLSREEDNNDNLDESGKSDDFESSDSGESEPEENDVCIKDKKRSKCFFADDEAEVTDDEDSDASTDNEGYSTDNEMEYNDKHSINFKHQNKKEHMNDHTSEVEIDEEEKQEENYYSNDNNDDSENLDIDMEDKTDADFKNEDDNNIHKDVKIIRNENNKKTKQLIQEFQDNSDLIKLSEAENENNRSKNITIDINKCEVYSEHNSSISEDENKISAFQGHTEIATRNQVYKTPSTKTSILDFVSPITQLSVLNTTLDSNKKDTPDKAEYLVDKHEYIPIENTQSDKFLKNGCNIRNKAISQKRLFDDIEETIDDEYLIQLCSGNFETQRTDLDLRDLPSQSNTTELGLKNSEIKSDTSQDIKLTLDENLSDNFTDHPKKEKKANIMNSKIKLKVASSDDDQSDEEDTFLKYKKRSVKKFKLSDTEESAESSNEEDNDINNEQAEEYVDYDSEENKIIVVPKKDIKKVAADFLEEEAELSESDWDSTDEDEKNMDKLEFEEADDEHIDEDEVKDQIGKIHMKQMLDEDKREVRLLKELLFEDGDLHTDGMGRERKFKWKNIDKLGNNIEMPQILDENDGWVDIQEDEEEAKWNKLRHERNKFLEERKKSCSNEIEEELNDSQIFKLGLEALKKIKNNESQKQDVPLDKIDSSEIMEPIMPQNITDLLDAPNIGKKSQTIHNVIKKRSLLTRGDETLARIASLAKQSNPVPHMVNARNFVFQYINSDTYNTPKNDEIRKKQEESEGRNSQNKLRKRKITSTLSSTRKRQRK